MNYNLIQRWPDAYEWKVIADDGHLIGWVVARWHLDDSSYYINQLFLGTSLFPYTTFATREEAAESLVSAMEPEKLTSLMIHERASKSIDGDIVGDHMEEDVIARMVLRAIADSRCSDPASIARAALSIIDVERDRYWA